MLATSDVRPSEVQTSVQGSLISHPQPSVTDLAAIDCEVVHSTAWRIRVQVPALGKDTAYAERLNRWIAALDGVAQVRLNLTARSIVVEYAERAEIAPRQQTLLNLIQQAADLEANPLARSPESTEPIAPPDVDLWQRLGLPAVGLLLSLGALLEIPLLGLVVGGVILWAAKPVFHRASRGLKQNRLNIDFLDGLAIGLHTLDGTYFASALMLGLIESGEAIRDLTARGSEQESLNLMDGLGQFARVDRNGQEELIPISAIAIGDLVIVYPGDQIPIDGSILQGTGMIDQCKLTGESVPVARTPGEEVFASTLLVDGCLHILAERTGAQTRASTIAALMQSAPVHDTRVGNYAASVADQVVLPTLLLSAAIGVTSGDISRAISILTLDIGTGIRISVPTAIMSALTYAARHGVLIRSGRAIEKLAQIDTVVFDKTGTLTQGRAGVTGIKPVQPELAARSLLTLAATAEQGLTHPVAEAIVRHATTQGISLGTCETWDYHVGLGVVATIQGDRILVGSQRFMIKEGISLQPLHQRYPDIRSGGHSLVYIARGDRLLGVILYSDPVRLESRAVIRALHEHKIDSYMLSGDVTRIAKAVAQELEMDLTHVHAEAFPERKVAVVKALGEEGKTVAFCGDGINDSAALAHAEVSISFADASDIARETADVVLMKNDLRGLILAIQVSRQTMEIIQQNIAIVALPNIGAMLASIVVPFNPLTAILVNNGTAILAALNALRPLLGVPELALDDRAPDPEDAAQDSPSIAPILLPNPLIQKDLALRLKLAPQTISRRKLKPDFAVWSQVKDPEGIAWEYNLASKQFRAIAPFRRDSPVPSSAPRIAIEPTC